MKSCVKICIDARMINSSGIGTYIKNVVPRVISIMPAATFYLIGNKDELKLFSWTEQPNVRLIDLRSKIFSMQEQIHLISTIPVDTSLFWSPQFNIPVVYRGTLVVTIHDIFHLAMPRHAGRLKALFARIFLVAVKHKAKKVICVSQFTKSEIERLVGISESKIFPIHLGVDDSWFNFGKQERPYDKAYLLYVGNVKPNKNLVALVKAFDLVKRIIPHDLVIVGRKEGFGTSDKAVLIEANKLGNRVHFTGFVEDDKLKQYFAYADMLVFPSVYEGFGLPMVEAMACGCPVIASKSASLPEIGGDAVQYCDPLSPGDIASKIQLLLSNEAYREELVARGLSRAKEFSWSSCAEETTKILESIIAGNDK